MCLKEDSFDTPLFQNNTTMKRLLLYATAAFAFIACGGDDNGSSSSEGGGGSSTELPVQTKSRTLAFPGAEGSASTITGGAAGTSVYIVTNTNDAGSGSFRDAVSVSGRTIVFAVSGTIHLESQLNITSNNLTIAGQTAPGGGICVAGYPVKISGNNIIVRFMRFRLGSQNIDKSNFDADAGDALEVKDCKDILIDHCSISWSTDECASFPRVTNLTVQYCIISESLKLSGHSKGNHGYGGIWGGQNATYHHNLIADHDSRNPRFGHQYTASVKDNNGNITGLIMGTIDYVNNVVYNWGSNSAYGGEGCDESYHINMIGNYYKPGPNSMSKHPDRLLEMTSSCSNCVDNSTSKVCHPGYFFISGNTVNGTTNKDWSGVDYANLSYKLSSRYTTGLIPYYTNPETAEQAYTNVLNYAGASLVRDAVDNRIITQVKNNTGALIDSQNEVGGYPTLPTGTAIIDSDKDGMPDEWELTMMKSLGVSGKTVNEFRPNAYNITGKYTNLEVYLNSLVINTFPSWAGASTVK